MIETEEIVTTEDETTGNGTLRPNEGSGLHAVGGAGNPAADRWRRPTWSCLMPIRGR
jgi:hypothetical protein